MRLETSVAHTVNVECLLVVYTSIAKCIKHSTWGVLSQGRNSKELTVRETHSGTLGFNGRQRPKPYQYLYVYLYLVNICYLLFFYTLFLFIYIHNKTVIL